MAVDTTTHANAAQALPGIENCCRARQHSVSSWSSGETVGEDTDRRDQLETRHNVMMLMRIKQLVAVPS